MPCSFTAEHMSHTCDVSDSCGGVAVEQACVVVRTPSLLCLVRMKATQLPAHPHTFGLSVVLGSRQTLNAGVNFRVVFSFCLCLLLFQKMSLRSSSV